ncbi:MAG: polyphosphate kinase [Phaeodactylibacter sp.]|nr:polyphosphate kinase [Phaeodactylibacter sp.]MCB9274058.1 polyphosphate kinase [Lewinellaceae bacterium]
MIKLSDIPTTPPADADEDKLKDETKHLVKRLGELQQLMYAQQKYSALVILQGMDGSGKDGAAKQVFAECHHYGVQVHSFKKPSEEEFAHDFLWRVHQQAPRKGMIQIFNRSQYEDILIQWVHGWIDDERAEKRMQAINAFEELLAFDNNTLVFKFYMHISYGQQAKELQERIDEPDKHWKHNPGDWKEREHWDDYMRCYEYAFNHSSIPWIIVPVDKRWYRDYVMAKALVERLEQLGMAYPPLPAE